MGTTRATFLIAAALVVLLVAAAAGIGAYIAVRHNAPAPDAVADQPEPETRTAAVLHGVDPQTITGEPVAGRGVAVESTEQIVEPVAADNLSGGVTSQGVEPVQVSRPEATAPRSAQPSRRAAARPAAPPPAPTSRRREPPRPSTAERAPPVPAAAQPEPEPEPRFEPEPAEPPARQRPARGDRDLPEIDGWKRADPAPSAAARDTPARNEGAPGDSPPPAAADFDPPTRGAGAEPPPPVTEELLIPADSVIGLQIDTFVTTDRAEVEDDVQARVTRDVLVSRRVAIPAGSLVNGSVVMVERGGNLQGAARLGVRFHTVVLDDGMEVPIATATVYREGRSRGRDNAARIGGGAVAGAILGAIFGGGRGAAIGGAAGAAGGTAAAAAGDAEPATLPAGTTLTVRLSRPSRVAVAR